MTYNCELLEQDPQPTLSIRTNTSIKNLPNELGKAYGAIGQYLGQLGEQPAGAPYAAYFDFNMDDFEVEIGFPVPKPLPEKEEIKNSEIPGGKLAQCLYTGPYNKIEPAYNALTAFVEENGYEATGVAYEFYLNDPGEVAPEELLTQIVFPLKAALNP
ncbi:MAG: GyrI-like domain-containing protein [Chloroflexota bacterium]|nr:MAG: GyrI-like domain-containing protein [Chloroflexota bacterium]